jgi:hypothetical protein
MFPWTDIGRRVLLIPAFLEKQARRRSRPMLRRILAVVTIVSSVSCCLPAWSGDTLDSHAAESSPFDTG